MDDAVIQSCFDGEGKKLLAQDFGVAQALAIGASPTFIANGRRQFNAVEVAALQKEYCQDNADLAACKTEAKAADPAAAAAAVPAGACKTQ